MKISDPSLAGLWSVRLVFLVEAITFGTWLPRIPDVKEGLGLEAGELGLALAGLPAGSLVGFMVAARFAQALGLRKACMVAGAAFALFFVPLSIVNSLIGLFLVLVLCGLGVALIEVAMSSKAGQIEKTSGRRIMSQCHGFWSIGSVVGALIGGAISQAGISPNLQFLLLNPLLAIAAIAVTWRMPPDPPGEENGDEKVGFLVLPDKALVILCLVPVGIMALEGAVIDWSALFVREVLSGQPIVAAAAYAVFSTMMAIMRLSGDRLAERFGSEHVVRACAIVAAAGIVVFSLAPNLPILFVGAALMGTGVAPIFPLAVSAAAASPGRSPEANVAAASFIAFLVFFVSPPVMGGLIELFDLRVAFLLMLPGVLLTAMLAPAVHVKREG